MAATTLAFCRAWQPSSPFPPPPGPAHRHAPTQKVRSPSPLPCPIPPHCFQACHGQRGGPRRSALARASSGDASTVTSGSSSILSPALQEALEKGEAAAVPAALDALKEGRQTQKWRSYPNIARRSTSLRELTQMGIKNAEELGAPSTRNEAAFLASVVIPTSLLAVVAGQLPGDWGFFVQYLLGSISLVVLGIGSTAPGLLRAPVALFGPAFSDYKERVLKHEAAHFLVAYLLGVPICSYSLDLGKEHVNLLDQQLQKRIFEGRLEPGELDRLAAVAMAGMAAEGLNFNNVMGQTADLISLQRLINRSKPPLSNEQQQNLTRWGVLYSASLIKTNAKAFDALVNAMQQGSSVQDCIAAVEAP